MYVCAIDKSAVGYHCKIKSNGRFARGFSVNFSDSHSFIFPVRFRMCKKGPQKSRFKKEISVSDRQTTKAPDQKQKLGYVKRPKKEPKSSQRLAKAEGLRKTAEKSPPNFSFSLYENDSHKMAHTKVWPAKSRKKTKMIINRVRNLK